MKGNQSRDVALLTMIGKYQSKMEQALAHFECKSPEQLRNNELALDVCAMYIAQIGEACKTLQKKADRR